MTPVPTSQALIIDEVADWIDVFNIARLLNVALDEEWGVATAERCQDLWYRVLYPLPSLIESCARRMPDPVAD